MSNLVESKRFVVRRSLVGQNKIIKVTFSDGKQAEYNHDEAFNIMKDKLEAMPCWQKYKSYTSSTNLPLSVRHLTVTE